MCFSFALAPKDTKDFFFFFHHTIMYIGNQSPWHEQLTLTKLSHTVSHLPRIFNLFKDLSNNYFEIFWEIISQFYEDYILRNIYIFHFKLISVITDA